MAALEDQLGQPRDRGADGDADRAGRPGSSPLVRTTLFRQRSFSVGLVLCLLFFAGIPSLFFTFLLTLQVGFAYQPVSAGAVTLAFAIMVAAGSARSAAVVKRLGTWTLMLGCALIAIGMAAVVVSLRWAGTGMHGYQLNPALIIAGAGAGLVLAPLTSVILAGVRPADAGAASRHRTPVIVTDSRHQLAA